MVKGVIAVILAKKTFCKNQENFTQNRDFWALNNYIYPEGADSVNEFSESLCEAWDGFEVGQAIELGSSDCIELKEPVEASS